MKFEELNFSMDAVQSGIMSLKLQARMTTIFHLLTKDLTEQELEALHRFEQERFAEGLLVLAGEQVQNLSTDELLALKAEIVEHTLPKKRKDLKSKADK